MGRAQPRRARGRKSSGGRCGVSDESRVGDGLGSGRACPWWAAGRLACLGRGSHPPGPGRAERRVAHKGRAGGLPALGRKACASPLTLLASSPCCPQGVLVGPAQAPPGQMEPPCGQNGWVGAPAGTVTPPQVPGLDVA